MSCFVSLFSALLFTAFKVTSITVFIHRFLDATDCLRRKPQFLTDLPVTLSGAYSIHGGGAHYYIVTLGKSREHAQ